MSSWTKENLETFIDMYRSFPCLWKIKRYDYKNKNLKNRAYQKLIDFCKMAVCPNANKDFVLKTIQGIRGSFRKELIIYTEMSECRFCVLKSSYVVLVLRKFGNLHRNI